MSQGLSRLAPSLLPKPAKLGVIVMAHRAPSLIANLHLGLFLLNNFESQVERAEIVFDGALRHKIFDGFDEGFLPNGRRIGPC